MKVDLDVLMYGYLKGIKNIRAKTDAKLFSKERIGLLFFAKNRHF